MLLADRQWTAHYTLYLSRLVCIYNRICSSIVGRDSSVGIATRYGLDGPEDRIPVGARFSEPVQNGPGAHSASCTMGTGSFLGVKRPGRGADHPSPSSAEVEGRVELYICSSSGPSWPVVGRAFQFVSVRVVLAGRLRYDTVHYGKWVPYRLTGCNNE